MIGKGYLSILFIVTAIVLLSNINANAQVSGTFSADLKPTVGSNSHATGKATLELQDNGQKVKYDVSGSELGNVSGVVISQEMGSGRAPDVVSLKQASTSGLKSGGGSASGTFTKSDLIGPLQGKDIADFVKAINDGKIVFRIMTTTYPLGEIVGNVTAGAGNVTAGAGNVTAGAGNVTAGAGNVTAGAGNTIGTAMNATANATGTAIGEANNILTTAANATTNATGEVMTKANSVLNLAASSGANATQTAMNQAKDIMTNVTKNVSSIASNASRAVLAEANNLINAASNATTNATNATGTTMTQPESVVSTASNATTNATNATGTKGNQTGNPILDALKSIFGGITGNK
ncbi:MAG TPA: CHRD domain-containing protein [Nitrososphaeraceae archaeon]